MVVGTAGTVGTGAVDPIRALADVCREERLWFHVDGAYGAPAAVLPDAPDDLKALALADSLAVDPHKWLYAPLEAGCVLVREPAGCPRPSGTTRPTIASRPREKSRRSTTTSSACRTRAGSARSRYGWASARRAATGYLRMIGDDCRLARQLLHAAVAAHPELEALTLGLSIATFRYVPADLRGRPGRPRSISTSSTRRCWTRLKTGGEVFVTNAQVRRPLCAARLHREFPHHRGRHRGDPGDRGPHGPRARRRASADRAEGRRDPLTPRRRYRTDAIYRAALLLVCSNVFMTFAWYAHLKNLADRPWYIAALVSWGIALFEYLLQVPANRIGYTTLSLAQLKILQEVITLLVFVPFAVALHEGADQARLPLGGALHAGRGVLRLPVARAMSPRPGDAAAAVRRVWPRHRVSRRAPARSASPFDGTPGPLDAITDVRGVTVGHSTIVRGQGTAQGGQGPGAHRA